MNMAIHCPVAMLQALEGILNYFFFYEEKPLHIQIQTFTGFANRSCPLESVFIKQSSHCHKEKK